MDWNNPDNWKILGYASLFFLAGIAFLYLLAVVSGVNRE